MGDKVRNTLLPKPKSATKPRGTPIIDTGVCTEEAIKTRKANANVIILPRLQQWVLPPCLLLLICLPLFSRHSHLQSNILEFALFTSSYRVVN